MMKADVFLRQAGELMEERAKDRDTGEERSMKRCVAAFNAMTGHSLSEEDGWQFMIYLKHSRARGGAFRLDDYEDAVAYQALAAEAATEANLVKTADKYVQGMKVPPVPKDYIPGKHIRPMFFDNTKDGGCAYPPNDKDT
jgi:hypothetical protein